MNIEDLLERQARAVERAATALEHISVAASDIAVSLERIADAIERNDPFMMKKAFADKAHTGRGEE